MGVYIEPPEVTVNSDEESADEEMVGAVSPRYKNWRYDNLSKQHYEAYAEIVFVNHKRVITAEKEDEEPKSSEKHENFLWESTEIPEKPNSLFPEPNYEAYQNKTPVEIFEQIFDVEIINYIIDETSKYAAHKSCQIPTLTPQELKIFVGILLLSGVRGTSKQYNFWESDTLWRSELLTKAMQRNRFVEICNFIHFADSTKMDESDKMWKLRPLMNLFRKRFVEMFQPEEHLSFGEYMADTCRRHNDFEWCNIPICYKIWCLNGTSGYLVNFDIFQRKNANEVKNETKFGVPGASMVQILDDLPQDISKLPFKIYFNQFFTSIGLLVHLQERGYDGTGSLKDSEVPESCPLSSSMEMKTRNKGAWEYSSCVDKNIMIARMNDASVVTVGSTCHNLQPVDVVVDKKQAISALYPSIFGNYRTFKKGTTRMDEILCKYGIKVEGKKWYWPLFTWLLDVAVYNSCILMQKAGSDITHVKFRKAIILAYLVGDSDDASV